MSDRAMDSYGAEDFVIPEIKLVQATGGDLAKAEGAKPGDFYSQVTGEVINGTDGFAITIVDIRKTRTYWGRDEISDDPPLCSSSDGVSNMVDGGPCQGCQFRNDTPWLLKPTERRNKCLLHYNVIAIKNETPLLIRVGGISAQGIRELLTTLRLSKQVKGEYHKVRVLVTSVSKKTASGTAFQMVFRPKGLIQDDEELLLLKEMSEEILGTTIDIPAEALEEAVEPEVKRITSGPIHEKQTITPQDVGKAETVLKPPADNIAEIPFEEAGYEPPAKKPVATRPASTKPPAQPAAKPVGKRPDVNF